ncbi:MAG: helix-hairpin-helix domain-containing protein [Flavobacteriaceae bacterium]|nr:helix-hairpin-helix domain-containing protein [Flavobacteriaceae bacterium]
MKNFKSHFRYNNSQRNGILFLALLIIILQLVYFFVVPIVIGVSDEDATDLNSNEIIEFQQEIDSLKLIALENKKPKIYPFNPSFLSDYRGYQIGMSTEEIDRLLQHRANGKYINSAKQFQQVTQISDSLLKTIEPYFKFPDWINKRRNQKNTAPLSPSTALRINSVETSENVIIKDLNSATAKELITVKGIGEKLSQRIVKYRNKLGGFFINEQLYEVWGLDKEVANKVLERFPIINKPTLEKINVNTATFKEVLSIVYIDYELTKKIFNYRDEVAELQSLEELKKIDGFPLEKFDRIALYLEAK